VPFNHPRSELHNLLRGKNPLCNKSADNHLTDPERSGGLSHGNPEALPRWRTCRKSLSVADVLHALLRPGIAGADAIAQPVQDRDDRTVFADQGEFTNQFSYLLGVDVVVVAGLVLAYCNLGVRASGPVELQMHRRRIIRRVGDHFLQDGAQDTLLQRGGRMRVIPELFQVVAQSQQLLTLLGCEMWGQSAGFFHVLL
jgi:hypothetical protein